MAEYKRKYLNRDEAASHLFDVYGIGDGNRKHLDNMAQRNVGPSYYLIRSKALYDLDELNEWAQRKVQGDGARAICWQNEPMVSI